ncbi:MAG: Benzoyl-CoA reductase subunit A [bacterium]|nr:Benzoyl-CoA reductase subunit A [bacterium]
MDYCVGIDLGSTTTKAVVIADTGAILGRGITNSRSSYDAACQVALTEALINTRFGLIKEGLPPSALAELDTFELAFRQAQYRQQLDLLRTTLHQVCTDLQLDAVYHGAIDSILEQMEAEAPALYAPGASRKSDFFRDLGGSRYLQLAERIARQTQLPYDLLVGLFDKAILLVENTVDAAAEFGPLSAMALSLVPDASEALRREVDRVAALELVQEASVGTGYGRQKLPFPEKQIRSEILCHGLGAHAMFPGTRTVLDIGGQDTKAIQVDEAGIVTSFQMNDRCAAGCGRYLGYIADEMNLGLHELGPIAEASRRPVRINSTCTVFAGAELRERLSLGEEREDILAGLHRAIILRALSLLARSGGVEDEFTFTGGVARNPAAVKALRQLIEDNYGSRQMNISPDSIYTGALGAALFALRSTAQAA